MPYFAKKFGKMPYFLKNSLFSVIDWHQTFAIHYLVFYFGKFGREVEEGVVGVGDFLVDYCVEACAQNFGDLGACCYAKRDYVLPANGQVTKLEGFVFGENLLEDGLNLIGEGEVSAEIFVVRVAVGAAEVAVDAKHFVGR